MKSRRRSEHVRDDRRALGVVRALIRAINGRKVDRIADLLTDNHRFIDSLGNVIHGGDEVATGFAAYFKMVPDYRIDVTHMLAKGNTVIAWGSAGGSYVPQGQDTAIGHWEIPAAWRAIVREGRVAEWQVYADNEPVRALMRESSFAGKGVKSK
jgi:ketosteroid isomerase-like protein